MKAVGITAEYNPLHNGHIYHIEQSRIRSGADAVIVAMSGDYVQRGEPAILDKWTRAKHALLCGADLVVEIPVLYCLGNAGQYASAAVSILESTGKLSHISFGSGSGDLSALCRIANILTYHADEISEAVSELIRSGLSYPAAREAAYTRIRSSHADNGAESAIDELLIEKGIFNDPNDILGIEYIRALRNALPLAIERVGAGYSHPYDESLRFQSASALREQIYAGNDISRYIPDCCNADINADHITGACLDGWWDILRYAVLTAPEELIEDCPSGGEGLSKLFKSSVRRADTSSWDSFIRSVKSKRYTYTRLSRLCMQIVLGITRSRYSCFTDNMAQPKYIRVLGFNDTGRELLAEIRKEECASLPIVTNINKESSLLDNEGLRQLELDVHASDVYNLITGRDINTGSDHRRHPVML